MATTYHIRLSTWAVQQGIHQKTALRWAHEGRVPGAFQTTSRRWMVEVTKGEGQEVAIYGRVSSSDQKEDLGRQMERLRDFAAARGLTITHEVSEIGSGLDGHRRELLGLLGDDSVRAILVEHRDRLARFGVEYIEATLGATGRVLMVANEGEQKLDLVEDFMDVVTSMCARIYGHRAAKIRAKRALQAAAEGGQ